jgi:hypothetical protein
MLLHAISLYSVHIFEKTSINKLKDWYFESAKNILVVLVF